MAKPKFHWLSPRPYPCNIGFTVDEKAFFREWKRVTDDAPSKEDIDHWKVGGARTWVFPQETNKCVDGAAFLPTYIITLGVRWEKFSMPILASLIAHECVHVVQFLWEQIGEHEPGKEAEAYFVQQLVQEILEILG